MGPKTPDNFVEQLNINTHEDHWNAYATEFLAGDVKRPARTDVTNTDPERF